MADALLKIDGISAGYHGQDVLRGLSLTVDEGSLVAIVGPNGHGKSTLLRAISGLLKLTGGSIQLGERRIDRLRPDQIVAAGVVQVPQGDLLFPEMTVLENLQMGAYLPTASARLASSMSGPRARSTRSIALCAARPIATSFGPRWKVFRRGWRMSQPTRVSSVSIG